MDVIGGRDPNQTLQYLQQLFKVVLIILGLLVCIYALNQFKLSHYFPIKTVRVYGVNHVDQTEVQQILMPMVRRGFFATNVDYIRDRLSQHPWIANIFVRRHWPDQIEINVVEKKAVALWGDGSLLSAAGDIFAPKQETFPEDLPKFIGPAGKHVMMLEYYDKMDRLFTPLHVKISELELTSYLTWRMRLSNGITLQLGHKDILTQLTHFVKVYPKIVGLHAADVDYIDLRYPNGMAVKWKKPIYT